MSEEILDLELKRHLLVELELESIMVAEFGTKIVFFFTDNS